MESNITKIFIKNSGKGVWPSPWIAYREEWPSPFGAYFHWWTSPLRPQPSPSQEKTYLGVVSFATVVWSRHAMALSNRENETKTTAANETTVSVAPMHFIFAQKYCDNRPQNTCASFDKLCFFSFSWRKVMRYFRSFESYDNIKNTKSPISTYPAKKK